MKRKTGKEEDGRGNKGNYYIKGAQNVEVMDSLLENLA